MVSHAPDMPPVAPYVYDVRQNTSHQELEVNQPVSPSVARIMELSPHLVLGSSDLLEYDPSRKLIHLSDAFKRLLKLLVETEDLDSTVLKVTTLPALNALLQKPQGQSGGLKRADGIERCGMEDNAKISEQRAKLVACIQELGFINPKPLQGRVSVDHALIFGARAQRLEGVRIPETLSFLQEQVTASQGVYLLGATRKLELDEIKLLRQELADASTALRDKWEPIFSNDSGKAETTEANAFLCLWECLAPEEIQKKLEGILKAINSTKIGSSYNNQEGNRPTTASTTDDWTDTYYEEDKKQAIFALVEQPYIRLFDQLRISALTRVKGQDECALEDAEKLKRIEARTVNTTFHFVTVAAPTPPPLSIQLDEIARHVYNTVKMLQELK